jgi:hypothetical protein
MLNGLTWAIVKAFFKNSHLLCNNVHGYWLLYDALNVVISINIKLQDEYRCRTKVQPFFICGKFKLELEIP